MSILVEQPVALAIVNHPEDAELLCAGTLALLKQRCWRIVIASMVSEEQTLEIALPSPAKPNKQATRSGHALEIEYRCLECPPFEIVYGDELCRRACGLIRRVRPALVFTHGPHDATPDREETSRIVRQACLTAPLEQYQTQQAAEPDEPTGRVPHLYYLDPYELIDILGRLVEAQLIVDITTTIDIKARTLAVDGNHSQAATDCQRIERRIDTMRAWGQRRGELVGCAFGEGFRQNVGYGYPRDDLLGEVLESLVYAVNAKG
ncbi:MAG: PIG-L family deacetylase [Planctomycetota bacterium]